VRQSALASIDIHKPSGARIVEQQLAPFLARIPEVSSTYRVALEGPHHRPHAIVVALSTPEIPRAVFASFLQDPIEPGEHMVFVCGGAWEASSVDHLLSLVRLYDLPASVIMTTEIATAPVALHIAARFARADDVLILSANSASPHPGWRQTLRRLSSDFDVCCPTLLFEDGAIRFAGASNVRLHDRSPFATIHVKNAGRPTAGRDRHCVESMLGGSLACALFKRRALPALSNTSRFTTEPFQEAAVFEGITRAGLSLGWVGSIEVVAPAGHEDGGRVARLVDSWMYRDLFGEATTCVS